MRHTSIVVSWLLAGLSLLGCGGGGGGYYIRPSQVGFQPALQDTVVSGFVVDLNNWFEDGGTGVKPQGRVSQRSPLAILTEQGSLIVPVSINEDSGPQPGTEMLLRLIGKPATVRGRIVTQPQMNVPYSYRCNNSHSGVDLRPNQNRVPLRVNAAFPKGIVISDIREDGNLTPAPSFAATVNPDTELVARVVNLNSLIAHARIGDDNREQAVCAAKQGQNLVMVGEDGSVYFPIIGEPASRHSDETPLLPYTEWTVLARGRVIHRTGQSALLLSKVTFAE